MVGGRPVIYLDACIFISMLTGEQRPNGESQDIAGLAIAIERKELIPVTSEISKVEILTSNLTVQQRNVMERLLRPPKVQMKDVTSPIIGLSADIRDFYQREKDTGRSALPTIETPDAIHLATAIYYECDAFYTFDENDRATGTRPKRGLIPLSGNVAGRYPLLISKPIVQARGLDLGGKEGG